MYTFDLFDIHFKEATPATEKKFEYIPGTDKIHAHIGGFNLSALVNADLKLTFNTLNFKDTGLDITNMKIDFTLEQTADADKTHWKLADTT